MENDMIQDLESAFEAADEDEKVEAIQPVTVKKRHFKTEETRKTQFKKKLQGQALEDVMTWAAENIRNSDIAKRLKDEHNITMTSSGVGEAIKRHARGRSTQSKLAVQENIGEYIINDLEVLKTKKKEFVLLCDQFKKDKDWSNYWKATDRIKDFSKMLFDLSGVNEGFHNSEAQNAKQDLLDMFEKFEYIPLAKKKYVEEDDGSGNE